MSHSTSRRKQRRKKTRNTASLLGSPTLNTRPQARKRQRSSGKSSNHSPVSALLNGLDELQEPIAIANSNDFRRMAYTLVNSLGYVLVLFSVLDYTLLIWGTDFTNLTASLQFMESLVSHVWALLMGLGLVFLRRWSQVKRLELALMPGLAWLALALGGCYLAIVPWSIYSASVLGTNGILQYEAQALVQQQHFQSVRQMLVSEPPTPQQLHLAALSLNLPPLLQSQSKAQALSAIGAEQVKQEQQLRQERQHYQRDLVLKGIRIALGSAIAGAFLLFFGWKVGETFAARANRQKQRHASEVPLPTPTEPGDM